MDPVYLIHTRGTKNTEVFEEELPEPKAKPVMGTIWLRKDRYEELGEPDRIKATLEKVEVEE